MTAAARAWVVIGAGYTGARVAAMLDGSVHGAVIVTRRDASAARSLAAQVGDHARGVGLDLATADRAAIAAIIPAGAIVAMLAPPARPDGAAEAEIAAAVVAAGAHRLVYVSSTGVYAPGGGAVVDEGFAIAPATTTGRARLAAERAIRAAIAAPRRVLLRAAGIYGPGRGVLARLRAGTYRVIGDGRAMVSRIHVDDLAAAVIAAGTVAEETIGTGDDAGIYNAADDEPCASADYADAAADAIGVPRPPRVPAAEVSGEVTGMLLADRRITSARMQRELGWRPRYPSWRAAIAAEPAADPRS
ncbi:MAG: NAD-dependent epimerase/dehydratase family protein [Deltaproteobacteria bacterium]|nr:NAD-dependent epimerase/dehydratase family protein [Deltaproteobacteria bacterium]